jgi:hypothetical protein
MVFLTTSEAFRLMFLKMIVSSRKNLSNQMQYVNFTQYFISHDFLSCFVHFLVSNFGLIFSLHLHDVFIFVGYLFYFTDFFVLIYCSG